MQNMNGSFLVFLLLSLGWSVRGLNVSDVVGEEAPEKELPGKEVGVVYVENVIHVLKQKYCTGVM